MKLIVQHLSSSSIYNSRNFGRNITKITRNLTRIELYRSGHCHHVLVKAKVSIIALWQGMDFKVLLPPKEGQLTSLCTQPQAHKWDQFQFRLLNSPDLHHLMTWCFRSHQESPAQVGKSFKGALLPILLSFFFFLEILTLLKFEK